MSDIILPNIHRQGCEHDGSDTTGDCESDVTIEEGGTPGTGPGDGDGDGDGDGNGDGDPGDPDPPVTGPSVLRLKPERTIAIVGQSIQFKAFLVGTDGSEQEVTMGVKYRSSNKGIFPIGITSGKGSTVVPGDVTISAEWSDLIASASVKIVDSCDDVKVGTAIMIDASPSMGQQFTTPPVQPSEIVYGTKFGMSKEVALAYAKDLQPGKDLQAVISFGGSADLLSTLEEGDAPDSEATLMAIENMTLHQTGSTNLYSALAMAIDALQFALEDGLITQRVLLIFSDGEQNVAPDPRQLAEEFKSQGGIIAVVGARAHGDGFRLLKSLATNGLFYNAKRSNSGALVETVRGIKGYWCAGNCTPDGDGVTVFSVPALDYRDLTNWDQPSDKYLDLIGGQPPHGQFDFIPFNGLYLDMAGSSNLAPDSNLGHITTKVPLNVESGDDYKLTVVMAGNQRDEVQSPTDQVGVKFTNPEESVNDIVEIHNAGQGFTAYEWTFTAPSTDVGNIDITFDTGPTDSVYGILIDRVIFENLTTATVLFDDNFDEENQQVIPSVCIEDTENGGYVGGNSKCYGHGCLDEPIPQQSEDSPPLPVFQETGNA